MKALLIRRESSSQGTFGTLELWSGLVLHTVELPWLNNQRSASCIPAGRYEVVRHQSPSKGDCYSLVSVPGRDHILIHAGNTIRDFEGCIGVGIGRGQIAGLPAVTASRHALRMLKAAAPDGFTLDIVSLCLEDFRVAA